MKNRVYLDHASTTYLDPRVKKAMDKFWIDTFGNPGGLYKEGREARQAVSEARKKIADVIGATDKEIIFTSGGTESNNLAIFGVVEAPGYPIAELTRLSDSRVLSHVITTKFEHPSVLNPIKQLERNGFSVTYLEVGKDGIVNPDDVKKALRPETVLVSVMYANNEIGTIQPIAEIGKVIRDFRKEKLKLKTDAKTPFFHTDACQAAGYLDLNVEKLGVDLMTVNGSKIYGPKGVGFLYVRKGMNLHPIIYGGGQEKGLRSGTENVPGIVGLAKALEISDKEKEKESKRLIKLRDYFIKKITTEIPEIFLNGHAEKRLPNNVNVSILGVEGEAVLLYLDEKGIACSTGSACSSESLEPSHVIMALGKPYEYGHGSLRFTMGRKTVKSDVDFVMSILPEIVKKLRVFSAI